MLNLLSAEYRRLFKNKILYLLCLASAAFGAFLPLAQHLSRDRNGDDFIPYSDTGVFALTFFAGLAAAVFISLFTGTEYSDGTIRNKLVAGHTRVSVYLSELTVNFSAMMLVTASFFAVFAPLGYFLINDRQYPAKMIATGIAAECLVFLVWTSVFTGLSLCCKNKAGVAVFSMVMCLALIVAASYFGGRLAEPETYPADMYMDESGVMRFEEERPNPNYLTGTKREVFQAIFDTLPSGQATQISGISSDPEVKTVFIPCSLLLAFIANLVAIPVFRRKNIN